MKTTEQEIEKIIEEGLTIREKEAMKKLTTKGKEIYKQNKKIGFENITKEIMECKQCKKRYNEDKTPFKTEAELCNKHNIWQ